MCQPMIRSNTPPVQSQAQNYQTLRRDGISKQELNQLSTQALADGKIDAAETQVFEDIVRSQGPVASADLVGLPPEVSALFNHLNHLKSQVKQAASSGGDDDYVRETISAQHLNLASAQEKAGMIVNLLDGFTGDDDEQMILKILRSANVDETLAALKSMGHLNWLFEDVQGSEYTELLQIDAQEIRSRFGQPAKPVATSIPIVAPAVPAAPAASAPPAPASATPTLATPEADQDGEATAVDITPETQAAEAPILNREDPRLSSARKRMFKEIDLVITTSTQGVAADTTGGKRNLYDGTHQYTEAEVKALQAAGKSVPTSCGLLPGSMMKHMGLKGDITGYATEGIESEGRRLGVWVESNGTNRPKPGDIYALRYPDKPSSAGVAHVGIIYDMSQADQGVWITADAGQGTHTQQKAELVTRSVKSHVDGFESADPFLSGPENTPGDSAAFRRIAGWVDIDRLVFVQKYEQLKSGGISGAELKQLSEMALEDGDLNESEQRVFSEIAKNRAQLKDEDIQAQPEAVRAFFQ